MLRIRFTSADLGRLRIATTVDPLWEIIGSIHVLQSPRISTVFQDWVADARVRLQHPTAAAAARLLGAMAPKGRYYPDFLTPSDPADLGTAVDTVLSTPVDRIAKEVRLLADWRYPDGRIPDFLRRLSRGEPATLHQLGAALLTYFRFFIEPHLSSIAGTVSRDRSRKLATICVAGTEGMLTSLGPPFRWRDRILEVDYPVDKTIELAGRGLLLVPSYFCWQRPVALADPDLPPTLVHPVDHDHPACSGGDGLGALLGSTRADVLRVVDTGVTTTGVASLLGIAPATACHHISVLREAGLIWAERDANRVLHSLTPLGADLLGSHAATIRSIRSEV